MSTPEKVGQHSVSPSLQKVAGNVHPRIYAHSLCANCQRSHWHAVRLLHSCVLANAHLQWTYTTWAPSDMGWLPVVVDGGPNCPCHWQLLYKRVLESTLLKQLAAMNVQHFSHV